MSFLTYDTADNIISSLEIIEKLLFPETDFWYDNYLKHYLKTWNWILCLEIQGSMQSKWNILPPTFKVSFGLATNSKFCGFKSMWQTLLSRKYFKAKASCCKNFLQQFSESLCFSFMKFERSPPLQYSITM